MARYTVRTLREDLGAFNRAYPLERENGYGNHDRFGIQQAYGYTRVVMFHEGTTGQSDTHVHGGTPHEAWMAFCEWLARNQDALTRR